MEPLILAFVEDSTGGSRSGFVDGHSFSPNWLVKNVAEVVAYLPFPVAVWH
jgi:hypothetical protein